MAYYGQDLRSLQAAAGVLGMTVDELIQFSRQRFDALESPPVEQFEDENPFTITSQPGGNNFTGTAHPAAPRETLPSDWTPPVSQSNEQVILLNEPVPWYDCNVGIQSLDLGFETIFQDDEDNPGDQFGPWDESMASEEFSYVGGLTPSTSNLDAQSSIVTNEPLSREDGINAESFPGDAMDWAVISRPPPDASSTASVSAWTPRKPSAVSSSPRSGSGRFLNIAPRPGRPAAPPVSSTPIQKARQRRRPYDAAKRKDTKTTRDNNACVRCRKQRIRCVPDPTNPRGPCLTCQSKVTRLSHLPCLRYKITEITLFRTDLDFVPFYRDHPLSGQRHGDFHVPKTWTASPPRMVCIGQLQGGMHINLELHEFVPPNYTDLDTKKRPMYLVPWAIRNPDVVVDAIQAYIEENFARYFHENLANAEPQVVEIFNAAHRTSVFPVPNPMMKKALKLWVASRFIEGKWRCWGDDLIEAFDLRSPWNGWNSLPPYLDYQIASLFIERILNPLRKDVLRELQTMVNEHRPEDWYVTFLTSYVLLHNYELQMAFQAKFALRRQNRFRFLDMRLVNATNSGAKTILAHFHYACKGQQPFRPEFDWSSPRVRRMARLDSEQSGFMANCRAHVLERVPEFNRLNHTDGYHRPHWYTSQLFDPEWTPRDTPEHSPPAAPVAADAASAQH